MVMKLVVEIVLAIFLHPLAYILCIINIVTREDLSGLAKVMWILITFFWGIGPILYVLLGGGSFW
jgi:phospholipase D-like protein